MDAGLHGGLIVVPSAPVLVDMADKSALQEALLNADMAITDSGLMVLLWRLLKREKLERLSGLEYLKLLLEKLASSPQSLVPSSTLWVMPNAAARDRNLAWLQSTGHRTTVDDCYVAPKYPAAGELVDGELLAMVQNRRPAHIILCVGGGVQERLGYFLKRELDKLSALNSPLPVPSSYRPGIHCVGAAIGFLTGDQVRIPMWADYFYLGWLFRCLSAPHRFVPRYWKAARLVGLMWHHGAEAPSVITKVRASSKS